MLLSGFVHMGMASCWLIWGFVLNFDGLLVFVHMWVWLLTVLFGVCFGVGFDFAPFGICSCGHDFLLSDLGFI